MVVKLLKLAAGIFEPLFFPGLVWCLIQLPLVLIFRKNALRCVLVLSTMLFIVWRAAIHLWAGHYASILILMLTLWCVDICRAFAENGWLARLHVGKAIAFLIFAVLVFACVAKNLRINRHANYILDCAELIRRDAGDKPDAVIWDHHNTTRMAYYSKLPGIPNQDLVQEDFDSRGLERFVEQYRYCGYPIYMVLREPGRGGQIAAGSLGLPDAQWRFLRSFYKNNKEKVSACVYLFDCRAGAVHASASAIADHCRRNARYLIRNGCFEDPMPEAQQRAAALQARQCGYSFWNGGISHPLPTDWSISGGTPFRDKGGEVELTSEALEGRRSLRMKANDLISAFALDLFPAEESEVCFLSCGTPGSKFELYLHLYDGRGKWLGCPRAAVFWADGSPRLHKLTIPKRAFRNAAQFRLCPAVRRGEVRWDAFSVRPIPAVKREVAK